MISSLFEESLSHTFVDDDECDMRQGLSLRFVFIDQNLL